MILLQKYKEFSIYQLTSDLAAKHAEHICALLDQIPLVDKHSPTQITALQKADRIFHAKWQHSFIVLDGDNEVAGVLLSYERESEKNEQYPYNSLYLSDFAVAAKHQKKGLGKYLIQLWLDLNKEKGFVELSGPLRFSIQTNLAEWNSHVQKLYESFGFKKISTKSYGDRTDNVYLLEV